MHIIYYDATVHNFNVYYLIHMLSDLGILAKSYIDQGKLVPDESMVKLLSGELEALASKSLLLDGQLTLTFSSYY